MRETLLEFLEVFDCHHAWGSNFFLSFYTTYVWDGVMGRSLGRDPQECCWEEHVTFFSFLKDSMPRICRAGRGGGCCSGTQESPCEPEGGGSWLELDNSRCSRKPGIVSGWTTKEPTRIAQPLFHVVKAQAKVTLLLISIDSLDSKTRSWVWRKLSCCFGLAGRAPDVLNCAT